MQQLFYIGGFVVVLMAALFTYSQFTAVPQEGQITQTSTTSNEFTLRDVVQNDAMNDDTENNASQAAAALEAGATTEVTIKTNKGDITLELFTEAMPITTENFLKLARDDFYDGIKFHRVIDGFMIQAGDPLTKDENAKSRWGTGGPGYTIEDEFVEGLSNVRGTVAMANTGRPNSGGSQFFINVADNTNLDFNKQPLASKHPVFGRVTGGLDVVDQIAQTETDPRDVPQEPVVIEDIAVASQ